MQINLRNSMREKGFTLIELIVVIIVIGLLLGIATVSYGNSQSRAKKEQAIATADKVKLALDTYYSEKDRYPREQSALVAFLNEKGQGATATAFNNPTVYVYMGTRANGDACTDTDANKCEKYTITIKKSVWQGGATEDDVVITP